MINKSSVVSFAFYCRLKEVQQIIWKSVRSRLFNYLHPDKGLHGFAGSFSIDTATWELKQIKYQINPTDISPHLCDDLDNEGLHEDLHDVLDELLGEDDAHDQLADGEGCRPDRHSGLGTGNSDFTHQINLILRVASTP